MVNMVHTQIFPLRNHFMNHNIILLLNQILFIFINICHNHVTGGTTNYLLILKDFKTKPPVSPRRKLNAVWILH